MKRILNYLKPYFGKMSLGLIIKFCGAIMDLLLPWILSYMIDEVVPLKRVDRIVLWGGMMILCAVIAIVTNIVANRVASWVARNATEHIRHDLFSQIMMLSSRQIDEFSLPSLELRLTSDTYNVHRMISMMQRLGIRAPILLLGGIAMTLTLEPVLALVLILTLPFIALLVWSVSSRGIPMYTALQQGTDRMIRVVRENISGIRVIKALSKTDYEKERFHQANDEVVELEKKAAITMALTNPMMNLFLNAGLTLVILVGAWRVDAGLTQPGKIIAFLSYFTIILNAMLSITRMFVMFSKGSASASRISEVLEAPKDLVVVERETVKEQVHVVFDHVSFSYSKKEYNLEDISFCLNRGETLGIIGATGSGKSTIVSLLMRLYDTDLGQIRINGQPVDSIQPEKLHTLFGVVFQNDFLIAETIQENIDFGRDLTWDQIEMAARSAQAGDFIDSLDDGFDHRITARGTNISGGQKQRLLVARALAHHPEILILDDSSSALDYKTDARLRGELREKYSDITSIIIAQRISSIKHAEHILVLDEGRTIGYGTHEELMKSCAAYREISISQMGGTD